MALAAVALALTVTLTPTPTPTPTTLAPTPILVVGHRGAPAELPESTLAGFARALETADAIEIDVRTTKDGVLVVHHDARIPQPAANAGARIRALTFAQLRAIDVGGARLPGAQVPSLDEVLALVAVQRPNARVLVELKSDDAPPPDELARLVVASLHRNRARARVIVESFDASLVAAFRRRAPEVARGFLCATCDERAIATAKELGARIVSPAHDGLERAFVDAAHARGLGVYTWTANDATTWTKLRALGVDAILTDDPRALRREIAR